MLKNLKEENVYLLLALIFGLILVFLIPPFQSPDEDSHFKKAYMISTGSFYGVNETNKIGNYVPSNILQYIDGKSALTGNRSAKFSYDYFILDLQTLKPTKETTFVNYSTVNINPIIYAVPAIGIILSRAIAFIIGLPSTITGMLYGARIMSLLVYSLIIYISIRIAPKFKKFILVTALMPMTIALMCCVSYDGLLISSSILLLSIILKYRCNKNDSKISIKDIIIISIIAFIYLNVKKIYVFNLLLLLLIPLKKYAYNKKDFVIKYGLSLIFVLLLNYLTNLPINLANTDLNPSGLISDQISFVLNNPFKYLLIYIHSLISGRFFYINSYIGLFGNLDTFLPYPVIFLYLLFIIITIILESNDSNVKINVFERLLCLAIPVVIVSLAFLGMYIYWTSSIMTNGVGADTISGIQGRYFIPAVISIIFIFANTYKNKKIDNLKKIYNNNYQYFYIFILFITTITIFLRFWI